MSLEINDLDRIRTVGDQMRKTMLWYGVLHAVFLTLAVVLAVGFYVEYRWSSFPLFRLQATNDIMILNQRLQAVESVVAPQPKASPSK